MIWLHICTLYYLTYRWKLFISLLDELSFPPLGNNRPLEDSSPLAPVFPEMIGCSFGRNKISCSGSSLCFDTWHESPSNSSGSNALCKVIVGKLAIKLAFFGTIFDIDTLTASQSESVDDSNDDWRRLRLSLVKLDVLACVCLLSLKLEFLERLLFLVCCCLDIRWWFLAFPVCTPFSLDNHI